jgi:hypothetical protein
MNYFEVLFQLLVSQSAAVHFTVKGVQHTLTIAVTPGASLSKFSLATVLAATAGYMGGQPVSQPFKLGNTVFTATLS